MIFEVGAWTVLTFSIYCVLVIAISKFVVRKISIIYTAYSIYHYQDEDEFEEECNHDDHERETISQKIKIISAYNAFAAVGTSVLLVVFEIFSGNLETISQNISIPISLRMILGFGVLATVFNTSLRLIAFGQDPRENEDINDNQAKNVRNMVMSFGFGFWVTFYFLFVIGVGLAVLGGDPSYGFQAFEGSFKEAIVVAFSILIIAPVIGALISECFLGYVLSIPSACKDCKKLENN